jgi:RNA polymerase sigma-70 factor, ECF subfamily
MSEVRQPEEPDESLVRRLQGGELAAFDVLFERYRRRMAAYVDGLLHDRGLAEDVTQECFLEMARRVDSIDPRKSLCGWLFRIARNRAIDLLRHRKFETTPGDEFFQAAEKRSGPDDEPGPAGRMIQTERHAEIRQALNRLSDKDRDVLLLRFYGGLTFEETARALRRPLGTVLWQSQRILKRLKGYLKTENGP